MTLFRDSMPNMTSKIPRELLPIRLNSRVPASRAVIDGNPSLLTRIPNLNIGWLPNNLRAPMVHSRFRARLTKT